LSVCLLQQRFEQRQIRRLKLPASLYLGAFQAALESRFSACINNYIRVPITRILHKERDVDELNKLVEKIVRSSAGPTGGERQVIR
jgi:hypothetical protein